MATITPEEYLKQAQEQNQAAKTMLQQFRDTYTPTAQREVKPSERTTTYEDLYRQMYETPMAKEEEDRCKRAATAVNAIGAFGNVANAFSNLLFTGKNAPSMTLPQYKGYDLQAFSDKAAQARRLYADAAIKGRLADDANYDKQEANRRADEAYNADVQARNNNMQLNLADRENALAKDSLGNAHTAWQMGNTEKQQEIQNKMAEKTFNANQAYRNAQLAETKNYHKQQMDSKRDALRYKASQKGAEQIVFDNSGFPYKFKDANKNKAFSQTQAIMDMINNSGYTPSQELKNDMAMAMGDQSKTLAVQQRMIAEYLRNADDTTIRDRLLKSGLLEAVPVDDKTYPTESGGWSLSGDNSSSSSNDGGWSLKDK